MKFFFKQSPTIDSTKNPTLKKFIQDHPQKFCDEWAATPNLFFSHVTSMNDFFYVYNALPQLQKQLQAYVEVSMATLLTWDLKASEFIQLLNIVNNKSKFLAALVQNPNNALHLFQKEQHKRELIQLVIGMANNSSSPLLASFFDLFFLDFINTMPIKETESFLLAVSQSCVHDWIEKKLTGSLFKDDKFLKIWPMLITICDVKMLNKKISDMNELNRLSVEKLSEIFTPLLSTQDDSNFIDLYNYFVDGNFLRVRAYFQQYFLDKLQKTDRASPELAELFAQRHLSPDTEFVQCTWEQHIHWIKLFPERLEILTTLLVNEEVFRARKVTVAQIEAMVATLGESGRVVLAILLRSIKRYKVSPFQTLDLDRLAVFASKQIGEKDCALAFCLVELYWDVVKWQGVDEDTFIAKCSSDACNEYACQQDAKGLTEFTRLLLTTPVHLFVLLFKRLTKETMGIALHMNREQVHRFFRSDAGKEKLQSVIAQLNQHEFAMLVTFLEPPFIFSGKLSNLRERFCDLLLDPNFNYEKAPGFSAFLTDANQAIFDNMLNIMGVDLKFLQRVRENESLQKYFATSLKSLNMNREIEEREFKLKCTNSPLTIGLLKQILAIWDQRIQSMAESTSWFSRKDHTPRFITDLKKFIAASMTRKRPEQEKIDDDEQLVLQMLFRDWSKDTSPYSLATRTAVESVTQLMKSTQSFAQSKPSLQINGAGIEFKDAAKHLDEIDNVLGRTLNSTDPAYTDCQKIIAVMRYITENLATKLTTYFKHSYGVLYINTPHKIPIHTDHAQRNDSEGFKHAMSQFVLNYIAAFEFAKNNHLLRDFFGKQYGGFCIEGRVTPCLEWASERQAASENIKLDDFMAKASQEYALYLKYVEGLAEDNVKLGDPDAAADFIFNRYGRMNCHPHDLAKNKIVTRDVIRQYCIEILEMKPESNLLKIIANKFS